MVNVVGTHAHGCLRQCAVLVCASSAADDTKLVPIISAALGNTPATLNKNYTDPRAHASAAESASALTALIEDLHGQATIPTIRSSPTQQDTLTAANVHTAAATVNKDVRQDTTFAQPNSTLNVNKRRHQWSSEVSEAQLVLRALLGRLAARVCA